jgi:triacylglycerol lipase
MAGPAVEAGGPPEERQVDSQLRGALERLGRDLNPEMMKATQALFAARMPADPGQGTMVTRDHRYGPDERHRLDIFAPETGGPPRPVLVFVHGGGFVMGDKTSPGSPLYDNLGYWAAAHGLIGVTVTYRLAPQNPWPAGAEDMGRAVEWLAGAVAGHGGDPQRVFLMGQSAEAAHVASYIGGPQFHRIPGSGLAGGLLISGLYDIAEATPNPFQRAYYGDDPATWGQCSSLDGLVRSDVPLLLSVSEFDIDDFQRQAGLVVAAALAARGEYPRMHYLAGHNHLSSVLQIGAPGETLGPEILRFVDAMAPRPQPGNIHTKEAARA